MTFFRPSRCVVSNVGVVKAEFDLPDQTCSVDRNLILQQASSDRHVTMTDTSQRHKCFPFKSGDPLPRISYLGQKDLCLIANRITGEMFIKCLQTCNNDRHVTKSYILFFSRQTDNMYLCPKMYFCAKRASKITVPPK